MLKVWNLHTPQWYIPQSTIQNGISLMIEISHNTSPFGKSHGQWLSSVQWRIYILRPKPLTTSSKSLLMNITASESNCNSIAPPLVKHYLDLRSPLIHFVTHLDGLCHSYLDVRTPVCMDYFKSTIQQYNAATYHTFPTNWRRLPLPLVW